VGAVVLRPLDAALRDGDRILAVLRGSAVNHGGRTNGYTVPDPAAQARVITSALARSGLDPDSVSYVEAHGTGTSLGDPIEIAGLTRAYGGNPRRAPAGGRRRMVSFGSIAVAARRESDRTSAGGSAEAVAAGCEKLLRSEAP
jgi:acyl transferase domain-containing protein